MTTIALRRRALGRSPRRLPRASPTAGRHRWAVERTPAWLKRYRRLAVRWARREDIHQAFLTLTCCVVCRANFAQGL